MLVFAYARGTLGGYIRISAGGRKILQRDLKQGPQWYSKKRKELLDCLLIGMVKGLKFSELKVHNIFENKIVATNKPL